MDRRFTLDHAAGNACLLVRLGVALDDVHVGDDHTIAVDEDTLPDGVAIREGRSAQVTLPVSEGQQRSVLFPLGEGTRNVQTRLDRLPGAALARRMREATEAAGRA